MSVGSQSSPYFVARFGLWSVFDWGDHISVVIEDERLSDVLWDYDDSSHKLEGDFINGLRTHPGAAAEFPEIHKVLTLIAQVRPSKEVAKAAFLAYFSSLHVNKEV